MDSMDNFRERLEALEQQTHAREVYTRTVERRLRWWRGLACGVGLLGRVGPPLPSGTAQSPAEPPLAQRVASLEQKLQSVSVGENEMVITGVNLRIVNGLGATTTANGLGNLLVGYNEERTSYPVDDPSPSNTRSGSHNVVVGSEHNFSRFGGLVAGRHNEISGTFAVVSGGYNNTASDAFAAVSGGRSNTADGNFAAVSGGENNTASGTAAAVSGGENNTASGTCGRRQWGTKQHVMAPSPLLVGEKITRPAAPGLPSWGEDNSANGNYAVVSGGGGNTASGRRAVVSGGGGNTANGPGAVGRVASSPADHGPAAAGRVASSPADHGVVAVGAVVLSPTDGSPGAAGRVIFSPTNSGEGAIGRVVLSPTDGGRSATGRVVFSPTDGGRGATGRVVFSSTNSGEIAISRIALSPTDGGEGVAGRVVVPPLTTAKVPLISLCLPATRPPKREKLCSLPTTTLCEPERVLLGGASTGSLVRSSL